MYKRSVAVMRMIVVAAIIARSVTARQPPSSSDQVGNGAAQAAEVAADKKKVTRNREDAAKAAIWEKAKSIWEKAMKPKPKSTRPAVSPLPPDPPASWKSPPSPPPWPKDSLAWISDPKTLEVEKARRLIGKLLPASDDLCSGPKRRYGDKYVCLDPAFNITRGDCLVYSAGSRGEIAFEKQINRDLGCEVHVFDPTLEEQRIDFNRVAYELRRYNATLHNFGLGGLDRTYPPRRVPYQWPGVKYGEQLNNASWSLRTIEGARRRLGHLDRPIDFLKMSATASTGPLCFGTARANDLARDTPH